MSDLATAYLKLVPSLKGAQKTIESELGGINTSGAGRKAGARFGDGMKGGIGSIAIGNFLANGLMSAAQTAAGAVKGVFQDAFDGFAAFEQLSGGVEKIFDQANIDQIMADAQAAYKNLNMSANEYLESINSVGATFAQTMGDQAGYDTAKKGMQAIADYASGTGANLSELNSKYQLITRSTSSYQSIADQFAGILPATSKDFLEQAKAAGLLSQSYENLTDVPIAEYQEAVTAMLEKGVSDMGLLGNTSEESMKTVSGAIAMTQKAWTNLLAELGKKDADIGARMDELFKSILGGEEGGGLLANILPLIGRILDSVGAALGQFAARAGEYLSANAPELIASASSMVNGVIGAVRENLPEMLDSAGELFMQVATAIAQNAPYILMSLAGLVLDIVTYVVTHAPDMFIAGLHLLQALIEAIVGAVGPTASAAGEVVNGALQAIAGFFSAMFDAGANLVRGLIEGIGSAIGGVADAIMGGISSAVGGVLDFLGIASPSKLFIGIGEYTMQGMALGIEDSAGLAAREMERAAGGVYAAAAIPPYSASAQIGASGAAPGIAQAIHNELSQMGVYIDGNTLVGSIAPRMDNALGAFV